MKSVVRFILFTILAGTLQVGPAFSQNPADQGVMRTVESMVYSGKCEEVMPMVEALMARNPGNLQVKHLLMDAHICRKELDTALILAEELISAASNQIMRFSYDLDAAGIYLKLGNTKSAAQKVQAAIDCDPKNPVSYQQASNMYMSAGYYADAAKLLVEGRKKFGDPTIFGRNLGQLYEVMRNYGDAAREYFQVLISDTTAEVYVTGKMEQLIKMGSDEAFDSGLKAALTDFVKLYPTNSNAHRYYGDFLMSQNKLDEAFLRFRIVDSLDNGYGKHILYFADVAKDDGDYASVDKACNYLLTRYPKSALRTQCEFLLAESYTLDKRYSEASAIYQKIADSSPADQDVSASLFALGIIKFQGLDDPKGALEVFNTILGRYKGTANAAMAQLHAANCHLALGEAPIADSLYAAIPKQLLPQQSQEELMFRQAELKFYQADFAAARDLYGKTMNAYPKSVYVNDCLRRIMMISDHPDAEEATLAIFAEAVYAEYRFKYDSSLADYNRLKQLEGSKLDEIAWYNSGEIYREQGKSALALAEYDSLITIYPKGFYAPRAVERKGDVFAELNKDCKQSKGMYESVLLQYPKSLNLEDVRKKLQRVDRVLCAQPDKPKS